MKTIRYSVHVPLLIAATVILWLVKDVQPPDSFREEDLSLFFQYGKIGVLYSSVIVASLTDRSGFFALKALGFILVSTLLSAWTPILGLYGSVVWNPLMRFFEPGGGNGIFFIFITGSTIGSAGLWILFGLIWKKSIRRVELLRTVILCVAATLLVIFTYGYLTEKMNEEIQFTLLTVMWWWAFSISIYWSDKSRETGMKRDRFETL